MAEPTINDLGACQQCGECCRIPCELIPSDLPPLLRQFGMSLPEFFQERLIAMLIGSRACADVVLMMVPVKRSTAGERFNKLLADNEYAHAAGTCVFLVEKKCAIHQFKPRGGRLLQCHKITGSVTIRSPWDWYFAHWFYNQHLFEMILPGIAGVFGELRSVFQQMSRAAAWYGYGAEYYQWQRERDGIIAHRLFPLFNGAGPRGGFFVMCD
ncbi:MAG: YkgJ family cysteine cluster protein [Verrucomicrobiae bacterium]|nr:YkgJ family cysteine cluster protein [Verrucomicrobiae bacterium]